MRNFACRRVRQRAPQSTAHRHFRMNPIEPRVQAALDAAMNLIRTAAASAAVRVAESLDLQAQNATRPAERELLFNAMQELRRNAGMFQAAFHETLRERVAKDLSPQVDHKRKLESADWESLSLVDVQEVETQMNHVRLGQLISHECDWQLRDLAAYMGSLLSLGRADDERLPRDGRSSTRSGHGDLDEASGPSDLDLLAAHRRALATAFPGGQSPDSVRDPMSPARGGGRAGIPQGRGSAAADQQLMTLL